jgi:hypothetical protein
MKKYRLLKTGNDNQFTGAPQFTTQQPVFETQKQPIFETQQQFTNQSPVFETQQQPQPVFQQGEYMNPPQYQQAPEEVSGGKAIDSNIVMSMMANMTKVIEELQRDRTQNQKLQVEMFKTIEQLSNRDTRDSAGIRRIPASIPLEDTLEVPAIFFAHNATTAIYDDSRKGSTTQIPYGRVKFEKWYRVHDTSGNSGKGVTTTMCVATVFSKSQAEYIRNHSLFGIKFFENIQEVRSISKDYNDRLVEAYNQVNRLTEHQLLQKLLEYDIRQTTMELVVEKRKLAIKMAEQAYDDNRKIVQRATTERVIAKAADGKLDMDEQGLESQLSREQTY